jgi:hypothetical protein
MRNLCKVHNRHSREGWNPFLPYEQSVSMGPRLRGNGAAVRISSVSANPAIFSHARRRESISGVGTRPWMGPRLREDDDARKNPAPQSLKQSFLASPTHGLPGRLAAIVPATASGLDFAAFRIESCKSHKHPLRKPRSRLPAHNKLLNIRWASHECLPGAQRIAQAMAAVMFWHVALRE